MKVGLDEVLNADVSELQCEEFGNDDLRESTIQAAVIYESDRKFD